MRCVFINIKEIAKLAGVSASTVSKIINNKDDSISSETRQRILKIIKQYHYVPYSKVLNNASVKNGLIGLIVPTNTQVYGEFIIGAERQLSENGYSLLLYNTYFKSVLEQKSLRVLSGKNVEGIMLWPCDPSESIPHLKKMQIPFIVTGVDCGKNKCISFTCSDKCAAFMATEHLIQNGHKNILCLCDKKNTQEGAELLEGYTQAFHSNNILYAATNVFMTADASETVHQAMPYLIGTNVTAVVCGSNKIAGIVYKELAMNGVTIPGEISVVSVHDSGIAELLSPKLSSVERPYRKMGASAADKLVRIIEEKPAFEPTCHQFAPVLQCRESVTSPKKQIFSSSQKIIVVGSMNIDIISSVPKIPTDGETVVSSGIILLPGGKGANQAVGVGKLGGTVYMIGCLGNDRDGKEIYNSLTKNFVKTSGVTFDMANTTGKAYINVSTGGESTIVVYPGANEMLDRKYIKSKQQLFQDAKYCLISMEIPIETVEYTIAMCDRMKVNVILKPSAVEKINPNVIHKIDYLVPNEKELNLLVEGSETIEEKADYFYEKGCKNIIVTLGSNGCYLKNETYSSFFPAADFVPVDTTGAADAFISALAVYLNEGKEIVSAIRFATFAAGISITRKGVQPALPDRAAVDIYQDEFNVTENET